MKNFKQKWENYWYYHKAATILVIIFVLAVVLFIATADDSRSLDGNISIVTEGVVSASTISFDELIQDKIEDVNGDGVLSLNVNELWIAGDGSSSSDATSLQSVLASFSTGDTGLYIFDKTNLDRFIVYDAFCPLKNVLSDDVLNAHETVMRDGTAYAISLKNCGLVENYDFETDDLYAAVIFDRPLEDTEIETKKLADNAKVVLCELLK